MRRATTLIPVIAVLLTLVSAPATEARSRASLHFGTGFSVGGFSFQLGFHAGHRDYYYRTRHRVHYPRYRCNDRCYVRGGHYYHHQSCPLIQHHFERHGYHPGAIHRSYAPRVDYHHDVRPYRHDDRYYDRRSRHERRYERRHRHDRYCDHGRRYEHWRERYRY